jgi:hypothetical protein
MNLLGRKPVGRNMFKSVNIIRVTFLDGFRKRINKM